MSDQDKREAQILSAAAAVIIRQGYDRTTMSDIAEEAGVSRGTVYLSFKDKEELFETLFYWEWTQYAQASLDALEADLQEMDRRDENWKKADQTHVR